jgi:site-specific recombinase XerD
MVKKKQTVSQVIKPLFSLVEPSHQMGKVLLSFIDDNYNKDTNTALIDATNDAEAISSFLNEYKEASETLRSYAKEIERLLLWCMHVAKTNISSLRRDHLISYQTFLSQPLPKKIWCGPSAGRLNKDGSLNATWRPFVRGLSASSIKKSIKILDSFFNYLVQTHYLVGNPLAVDRRRKRRHQPKPLIDRYLELDEIHATLAGLEEQTALDATQQFHIIRARYIILVLFYSGLRIAEAANHHMGHFMQREGNWFLRVVGKGKKMREIPVPDALKKALADFRLQVGLSTAEPQFREKTPLIPRENLKHPITARRIDQILKWAFHLGANQFEPHHPQKASKLRQASAHWLRHSYVTYLLESGAPLKVAQENAGHSDIGTTMLYRHVAQTDRFEATRCLSLNKKQPSKKRRDQA